MTSFLVTLLAFPLFLLFLISILRSFRSKTLLRLAPGPTGLPIIGNLHQLDISDLPDHLWSLSKRYGPLMSIRLGMVQTLVVSSAEMAKEILKTNDLNFCSRPLLTGMQMISYDHKDIAFSPYNEYWRHMRKTCILYLFSMKQVNSFRWVREEEVFDMINTIKTRIPSKQVVNLSETVMILTSNIITRVAFGKRPSAYTDGQEDVRRFQENMHEYQAMLVNFYFKDSFPLLGWLDKLNGTMARFEKLLKTMDEFYQQLIDEHLNPNKPNIMQKDMVDILLELKISDRSLNLSFDHIKAILMGLFIMVGSGEKFNEDLLFGSNENVYIVPSDSATVSSKVTDPNGGVNNIISDAIGGDGGVTLDKSDGVSPGLAHATNKTSFDVAFKSQDFGIEKFNEDLLFGSNENVYIVPSDSATASSKVTDPNGGVNNIISDAIGGDGGVTLDKYDGVSPGLAHATNKTSFDVAFKSQDFGIDYKVQGF
ncbi:cytochrome P450 [Artemisia annua]|uniref:Cytochrome P450 n=1 Tax=Artemisia annua TaxID=35608 RepID=A0A2U1M7R8_ARTAN|nr:cytochrome P450 [Artemisia annua]